MAVWAACISWLSTGAFSAQSTHNYIDPVLRFLFGDLSPAGFRFAHAVIRKSAHFVEYGALAILLGRALAPAVSGRALGATLVRTVIYCALYAGADELHQAFESSRTGSLLDVGIDTSGALAGAFLLGWWRTRRARDAPGRLAADA